MNSGLARLEKHAVDRAVEAYLLLEGEREGGGTRDIKAHINPGREFTVNDVREITLTKIGHFAHLAADGLEGVFEFINNGLRSLGDATEVEDRSRAVGAGSGLRLGHKDVACW